MRKHVTVYEAIAEYPRVKDDQVKPYAAWDIISPDCVHLVDCRLIPCFTRHLNLWYRAALKDIISLTFGQMPRASDGVPAVRHSSSRLVDSLVNWLAVDAIHLSMSKAVRNAIRM